MKFHFLNEIVYVCRTDKAALGRNLSTVVNLRSEVFALERELTKQKVKCRALEEELQNPLNIHRWRKLEVLLFKNLSLNL